MTRTNLAAATLSLAVIAGPCPTEMITFAKDPAGSVPSDFELGRTGAGGPGRWIVVRDDSADGGHAIEQQSQDQNDYRFPLAIYRPLSGKDVDVQIRFKAIAGKIDRAGGIAVRLTSPDNYYVVRANALEDNVRFYRVVAGKREQLATANVKVPSNEWHTLGLRAQGERFTISFKGKELYSATDKTFAAAGSVALWTKADSVTRFDKLDINVRP